MRVDQWVPTLHAGDAIGDSARLMREAFRAWGHAADIFALEVDEELRGEARAYSEWRPGRPGDVLLLHYALPSPLTEGFRRQAGRRILLHHNITPPEFFLGYDPEMARICSLGREELGSLRDCADLGLADSEFNRLELERAGFKRTGVLPIYTDFARYEEPPNRVLLKALRDGRTNLLFVGRVAPNKRHEDLIRLASLWKRFIAPEVRLLLVGKLPRHRHYLDALQALMYEEGLTPWEVVFAGHVEHDDLLACYAAADLFLSMSEHEGFGLPLVEAMLMKVPILAYAAAAVPDTLGGAGVQFSEKSLIEVAELGHRLVTDASLRQAVLRGQDKRLAAFAPSTVEAVLRTHLESL